MVIEKPVVLSNFSVIISSGSNAEISKMRHPATRQGDNNAISKIFYS